MALDSARELKPVISCFGLSHKTAPLAFRESVYVCEERLCAVLPLLQAEFGFAELLVLSTCNRLELYTLSTGPLPEATLASVMDRIGRGPGEGTAPATTELSRYCYFHEGPRAIEHLFAVTSSLDSLIVGETQITGQFKRSLALAAQAKTLGPYLDRLGQEALATAKKIRTQTRISERTVSISHAAIDLAKRVFRDLSEHSFLILGAGEMAELAALYASQYKPREIYIANRSLERARGLVDRLGVGQAHSSDQVSELLGKADVVISATSAPELLITLPQLKPIMRQRRSRPLFLVDIAIPRDIDPQCGELEDVYLFDIDDLKKVVDDNLEERRQAAGEARLLIQKAVEHYELWLSNVSVKPVLSNFRDYVGTLMEQEMTKTLNRDMFRGLSTRQILGLQQMLDAVGRKIVSDAARVLCNPDELRRDDLAKALSTLFAQAPSAPAPDLWLASLEPSERSKSL